MQSRHNYLRRRRVNRPKRSDYALCTRGNERVNGAFTAVGHRHDLRAPIRTDDATNASCKRLADSARVEAPFEFIGSEYDTQMWLQVRQRDVERVGLTRRQR